MTIEEALRKAEKTGITHLSLWPVPSVDGQKTYWTCRATPSAVYNFVEARSYDPADAVTECLKLLKGATKKITAKVSPPRDEVTGKTFEEEFGCEPEDVVEDRPTPKGDVNWFNV